MDNNKLKHTLIFLLKMLAFWPILFLVDRFVDFSVLQNIIAIQVSNILGIFGIESNVINSSIFLGYEHIISKDSTAWKSMLFLIALIFATKSSIQKKLWGILLGIELLYIVNIIRILVNSFAGLHSDRLFMIFHDILWQIGLIVAVIGIWIGWRRLVSDKSH